MISCSANPLSVNPDKGPVAEVNGPPRDKAFKRCDSAATLSRSVGRAENPDPPGPPLFTGSECDEVPIANNLYTVLSDECNFAGALGGKARTLVRKISQFGCPQEREPPTDVRCGGLRHAVRQCFPALLSEEWELSFKSVQKLETRCCSACEPRFMEKLDEWKEARFRPQSVDVKHLLLFKRSFAANVQYGWNLMKRPFIPNGHATLYHKRSEGGNWNNESFSDECSATLVFSSGKPRVVTLYSSENTRVLAPLHYSLYSSLQRQGWLLVGEPTRRHISALNGADFISVDYQAATDNIKLEYVRTAIEVLIDKAVDLGQDEIRAMRVLGNLKLVGDERVAESGQPMGSVFSFPLLCLINKTVVDMSLTGLLRERKISFKEWSTHRLWVNGDDLVTREPRGNTDLRRRIAQTGHAVGLVLNEEKTMVHPSKCEINSALFDGAEPCKKINLSAMYMKPDVTDVLGFAAQASKTIAQFRTFVRANCHILSKQEDKHFDELPAVFHAVCRKDRKIRRALTSSPATIRPVESGVISMGQRPEDYNLPRDREHEAMTDEINRVREAAIERCARVKPKHRSKIVRDTHSFSSLLKVERASVRELIPSCYVRRFQELRWESVCEGPVAGPEFEIVTDMSRINFMIDQIKTWRALRDPPKRPESQPEAEYISLAC